MCSKFETRRRAGGWTGGRGPNLPSPANSAYPVDFFNQKYELLEPELTRWKQTRGPNRKYFVRFGFLTIAANSKKPETSRSNLGARIDLVQCKFIDGDLARA
jgi:hypothetical protein